MIYKTIIIMLILISLVGCTDSKKEIQVIKRDYAELIVSDIRDELIMISSDSICKFGSSCAFINSLGDTVIPFGKYEVFDFVKFESYAIVHSIGGGVVGINRKGEIMFDAYLYGDFQLDEISEGLFRVKRNGKVGYADKSGKIVIPCQFKCAEQFKNGKVRVAFDCEFIYDDIDQIEAKSNNWFYIDKEGNKLATP